FGLLHSGRTAAKVGYPSRPNLLLCDRRQNRLCRRSGNRCIRSRNLSQIRHEVAAIEKLIP
ncbi:MAG: hypothetical protein ACK56I_09315, partial [bacterium]